MGPLLGLILCCLGVCGAVQIACTVDDECPSGMWCTPDMGACRDRILTGGECWGHQICADGLVCSSEKEDAICEWRGPGKAPHNPAFDRCAYACEQICLADLYCCSANLWDFNCNDAMAALDIGGKRCAFQQACFPGTKPNIQPQKPPTKETTDTISLTQPPVAPPPWNGEFFPTTPGFFILPSQAPGTCATSFQCPQQQFCSQITSRCVDKRKNGHVCNAVALCMDQFLCIAGKCVDPNKPFPSTATTPVKVVETTKPTTPKPTPNPLCTDFMVDGKVWHDKFGEKYGCQNHYTNKIVCERDGHKYTNQGKTANTACCACGGGVRADAAVQTCTDVQINDKPWFDASGAEYTCKDYYTSEATCAAHGTKFLNMGFTGKAACCTCGGGVRNGISPKACFDKTVDGVPWHDAGGVKYGCGNYYQTRERCNKDGNKYPWGGLTAKSACCLCGGGDVKG